MAHRVTKSTLVTALAALLLASAAWAFDTGLGNVFVEHQGAHKIVHYTISDASGDRYARADVVCDVTTPSGRVIHLRGHSAMRRQRTYVADFQFTAWRPGRYTVRCAWLISRDDVPTGQYAVAQTTFVW